MYPYYPQSIFPNFSRDVSQWNANTVPLQKGSAYHESLTPDNAVLVMIDYSTGIMSTIQDIDPINLKNNIVALAKIGRLFNLPTVLTQTGFNEVLPNGPWWKELRDIFPEVPIIFRKVINAWHDPMVSETIRRTGRKKLIMAGVTSDVCLALPAISALGDGYDVYAVMDASGTRDKLVQQITMHRMTQAGVILTSWSAVAAELQRDWRLPTSEAYLEIEIKHLSNYGLSVQGLNAASTMNK